MVDFQLEGYDEAQYVSVHIPRYFVKNGTKQDKILGLYQLGFKPKDDFWATKDDDGPYIAWWTKRVEFPDDETLYAAAIEWGEKQKLIDCIYKRKQEYPTIEELVVALYDTEDKPAISAKRAAVKAKYPKPE